MALFGTISSDSFVPLGCDLSISVSSEQGLGGQVHSFSLLSLLPLACRVCVGEGGEGKSKGKSTGEILILSATVANMRHEWNMLGKVFLLDLLSLIVLLLRDKGRSQCQPLKGNPFHIGKL